MPGPFSCVVDGRLGRGVSLVVIEPQRTQRTAARGCSRAQGVADRHGRRGATKAPRSERGNSTARKHRRPKWRVADCRRAVPLKRRRPWRRDSLYARAESDPRQQSSASSAVDLPKPSSHANPPPATTKPAPHRSRHRPSTNESSRRVSPGATNGRQRPRSGAAGDGYHRPHPHRRGRDGGRGRGPARERPACAWPPCWPAARGFP